MAVSTRFSLKATDRRKTKRRAFSLLHAHRGKVEEVVQEAKAFSEDFRRSIDVIVDPKLKDTASR